MRIAYLILKKKEIITNHYFIVVTDVFQKIVSCGP